LLEGILKIELGWLLAGGFFLLAHLAFSPRVAAGPVL